MFDKLIKCIQNYNVEKQIDTVLIHYIGLGVKLITNLRLKIK